MSLAWKSHATAVAALLAASVCYAEEMKYPRTEIEAGNGQETLTYNVANWHVSHLV